MRYLPLLLIVFILPSCNLNEELSTTPPTDCERIHTVSMTLKPMSESILVDYGFHDPYNFFIDPPLNPLVSCEPESMELLISTDGLNFESVTILEEISGSYLIENLQDCEWVTVKIRGSHPDLTPVANEKSTAVGEIPFPELSNNPLPMIEFALANDGDQFVYASNGWFLSSFSNPTQGQQIFSDDVNRIRINPVIGNKVAGVENILVPIAPNTNGISSKYLLEHDLNTGTTEILHEIENHMDYNNSVYNPDLYWIHEFHYSIDGQSIYFISNKDNGGSSIFDQKVYDNIWKLDLATKEIESITDFLPIEFDLVDFVEDPKQPGNFYISGGERDVQIVTDEYVYFIDRVDIHYYNSIDKSMTPIFVSNEETEYLSIDPTGEHLVFTTMVSGKSELRSFHISSQKQRQLSDTHNDGYTPSNRWLTLNWISPTEFIVTVRHDDDLKIATFSVE